MESHGREILRNLSHIDNDISWFYGNLYAKGDNFRVLLEDLERCPISQEQVSWLEFGKDFQRGHECLDFCDYCLPKVVEYFKKKKLLHEIFFFF